MNSSAPDFEVGIIGGGPAGSSMAAYLAKAGKKVLVLERKPWPGGGVEMAGELVRFGQELGPAWQPVVACPTPPAE